MINTEITIPLQELISSGNNWINRSFPHQNRKIDQLAKDCLECLNQSKTQLKKKKWVLYKVLLLNGETNAVGICQKKRIWFSPTLSARTHIGSGAAGAVYKFAILIWKENQEWKIEHEIAFKKCNLCPTEISSNYGYDTYTREKVPYLEEEYTMAQHLKKAGSNPLVFGITKYDKTKRDDSSAILFMKLCDFSLYNIFKKFGPKLSKQEKIFCIYQLIHQVRLIHDDKCLIAHRDIKLRNILVKKEEGFMRCYLHDFGISQKFESSDDARFEQNRKIDICQLIIVVFQLALNNRFNIDEAPESLRYFNLEANFPKLKEFDPTLGKIVRALHDEITQEHPLKTGYTG